METIKDDLREVREAAERFWQASEVTLKRMERLLAFFSPSNQKKIEQELNGLLSAGSTVPSGHEKHGCCMHVLQWQLQNNFLMFGSIFGGDIMLKESSAVGQFRVSWRYFGGETTFDVRMQDSVPFLKSGFFGWAEKTRSEFVDEMKKYVHVDAIAGFFTDAALRLPQLEEQTISLFISFFSISGNLDFPFFLNRVRQLL